MEELFLGKTVQYWIEIDKKILSGEPLIDILQRENILLWNRLKQKESDTELVEKAIDCGIPPEYREAILEFAHRKEKPL